MIEINNLSKRYDDNQVLNNISITIRDGKIVGLLGANGAGKSTFLKCVTGMIPFDSGKVDVDGISLKENKTSVHQRMGILFGSDTGLYDNLTVYENLLFFGELQNIGKERLHNQILALASDFNCTDYLDKRAGKLSKGMTQKVVLARSVIHSPQNILLDEPESGLDFKEIRNIKRFILNKKSEGKAVIFSSHSLELIQELSDEMVLLERGILSNIKDASYIDSY